MEITDPIIILTDIGGGLNFQSKLSVISRSYWQFMELCFMVNKDTNYIALLYPVQDN